MLEFTEEGHVYTWDGAVVPSVTQVLDPLNNFDGIPWHVLENARVRGEAVHKACELFDYGTLNEETLDPVLQPYLEAWKFFLHVHDMEPVLTEQRLYHPDKGYAGTLDKILCHKPTGEMSLGDIKATYAHVQTVGPQTVAYLDAWNAEYPDNQIKERLSIRLLDTGKFDLVKLRDRNDTRVFQSCLHIWKWREKHYE